MDKHRCTVRRPSRQWPLGSLDSPDDTHRVRISPSLSSSSIPCGSSRSATKSRSPRHRRTQHTVQGQGTPADFLTESYAEGGFEAEEANTKDFPSAFADPRPTGGYLPITHPTTEIGQHSQSPVFHRVLQHATIQHDSEATSSTTPSGQDADDCIIVSSGWYSDECPLSRIFPRS